MVPARKIRSACLRFLPGHWALSMQNLILLRFTDTPGFAEPTPPVRILTGGPRASPTQFRKVFLRTAGEGLKVNRPKAERSHHGVCPLPPFSRNGPLSAVGAAISRPQPLPPAAGVLSLQKLPLVRFHSCTWAGRAGGGWCWAVGRGLLDAPRVSAGRPVSGPYDENGRFPDSP